MDSNLELALITSVIRAIFVSVLYDSIKFLMIVHEAKRYAQAVPKAAL